MTVERVVRPGPDFGRRDDCILGTYRDLYERTGYTLSGSLRAHVRRNVRGKGQLIDVNR